MQKTPIHILAPSWDHITLSTPPQDRLPSRSIGAGRAIAAASPPASPPDPRAHAVSFSLSGEAFLAQEACIPAAVAARAGALASLVPRGGDERMVVASRGGEGWLPSLRVAGGGVSVGEARWLPVRFRVCADCDAPSGKAVLGCPCRSSCSCSCSCK